MSRTLLEAPIRFGGPDTIVKIDESTWGNKRTYNRGRISRTNDWIFGLIQRDTGRSLALFIVNNRSAAELLPRIQNIVLPGTTIISDQWAAYNSLNTLGYMHLTVNHSENFIDPATGSRTQTIESFWSHYSVGRVACSSPAVARTTYFAYRQHSLQRVYAINYYIPNRYVYNTREEYTIYTMYKDQIKH